MQVQIAFSGRKFLLRGDDFSESLLYVIENGFAIRSNEQLAQMTDEIEDIKHICKTDAIEHVIGKHLTLDVDFALKLNLLDSVHCSCLEPMSKLGEALKELMIDEYELILNERTWLETDKLFLYFEVVDCGSRAAYIARFMKGKSHNRPKGFINL